ncbi:6-phosphogluconate dehydrogenase, decarboxylating [Zancudomyces culisetae]|uniref:6-phosphogluconate dehydrogenase, decarboxylating n=1 Tax=Zancudomyces culisetae TaxID=1213189 RepID=A0A1R1PDR7_ZANCU|nr:6-phosphogluconate dehydrogenase, decarboxylating [Zancudomyces culisetae]OMH79900.1 6-phosphogluconate dehydrogenase, decarboxylating [Zancudomyces culisetae]OMH81022.1 6-phosphogluconate dehydrogenase, decarboxylating [Zancudomyces culisetae]|eukprot:OMH79058.1 6-phosphogluconate dehydrogenase, decarboxylating [Zancudomyces culisetae]
MNDHGYVVCAFNRTTSKVDRFLENEAKGTNIVGAHSIEELCSKLKRPRRIMVMVKAGQPVDDLIDDLLPHLEEGDIVIDGGNSHYPDTQRRYEDLKGKGILYLGTGVSGGEEGARYGPSIMPGGNKDAWPHVKDIFQAISAKAPDGSPCCEWVGEGGAGHFVKMVHNGIEYGDMQLICEAYQLMRDVYKMSDDQMGSVFDRWNNGVLDSFLIEITRDILKFKDTDGSPLVEKIRDTAGQKGTGKWTAIEALNGGIPVTLIGEAVFARCLSALKSERVRASKMLHGPTEAPKVAVTQQKVDDLEQALYASKIISYAQGFMMMREASKTYNWNLQFGSIALMWRGGCIIRSSFLGKIKDAFDVNPDIESLLFADFFKQATATAQSGWRNAVLDCVATGIPCPAMSTALSFYDGYRCARLPANLLQAQRDYFGAHTYELEDKPGNWVHTNWTGHGGEISSSTYNA